MFRFCPNKSSKSFLKSFLSSQKSYLSISKQFYYTGHRYFGLKTQGETDKPEQVIISEEELLNSKLLKDKTFRERNKLTLGMFTTAVITSIFGIF